MIKIRIRWLTKDKTNQEKIREKFNLPFFMTVNKITPCEVHEDDMQLLEECEKRGFIKLLKT